MSPTNTPLPDTELPKATTPPRPLGDTTRIQETPVGSIASHDDAREVLALQNTLSTESALLNRIRSICGERIVRSDGNIQKPIDTVALPLCLDDVMKNIYAQLGKILPHTQAHLKIIMHDTSIHIGDITVEVPDYMTHFNTSPEAVLRQLQEPVVMYYGKNKTPLEDAWISQNQEYEISQIATYLRGKTPFDIYRDALPILQKEGHEF